MQILLLTKGKKPKEGFDKEHYEVAREDAKGKMKGGEAEFTMC